MRILFLTPDLPSPPTWGGARRMHGLMAGLARSHSVSVLSFVMPGKDHAAALAETGRYCEEVVTVANDCFDTAGPRKRLLQLKSTLLSPYSFRRAVGYRPALQAALDALVSRQRYDVINVEFSYLGYYRFPRSTKLVLDEHNIEYDILRRTYEVETRAERKLFNYIDYLKLRREERAIWRKFDGCVVTSARDEELLLRDCPATQTAVVPNAVDTAFFRPALTAPDPGTIVFFGVIDYWPNTDGLLFFLDEVLPRLRRSHPQAKIVIVGASPPEVITSRAGADVTVTGFVDDVRPYLERASAIIAPLRIGGGTRLKILEAMATARPVISTTVGAEGIDVTDGEDILLADDPEAFAAQVGRVLDDSALARRLGENARCLVEQRYDWQASVTRLERFYHELPVPTVNPLSSGTRGATPQARVG